MIVDCSTNSNQSTVYLVNKYFFGAKPISFPLLPPIGAYCLSRLYFHYVYYIVSSPKQIGNK